MVATKKRRPNFIVPPELGSDSIRLNAFWSIYGGKPLDYDGVFGAQCVDVVKAWINFTDNELHHYKRIAIYTGNAWQICAEHTLKMYCHPVDSKSAVKPGDIVVWGKSAVSPTGHCGVIVRCSSREVVVLEQDGSKKNAKLVKRRRWWHSQALPFGCILRIKNNYDCGVRKPLVEWERSPVTSNPAKVFMQDSAQRGAKVVGVATGLWGIMAVLIERFKEAESQIGDLFHLSHPAVIVGAIAIVGLPLLYKYATIKVRRGHPSRLFKFIIKIFGSAAHAEKVGSPAIREIFGVDPDWSNHL